MGDKELEKRIAAFAKECSFYGPKWDVSDMMQQIFDKAKSCSRGEEGSKPYNNDGRYHVYTMFARAIREKTDCLKHKYGWPRELVELVNFVFPMDGETASREHDRELTLKELVDDSFLLSEVVQAYPEHAFDHFVH